MLHSFIFLSLDLILFFTRLLVYHLKLLNFLSNQNEEAQIKFFLLNFIYCIILYNDFLIPYINFNFIFLNIVYLILNQYL